MPTLRNRFLSPHLDWACSRDKGREGSSPYRSTVGSIIPRPQWISGLSPGTCTLAELGVKLHVAAYSMSSLCGMSVSRINSERSGCSSCDYIIVSDKALTHRIYHTPLHTSVPIKKQCTNKDHYQCVTARPEEKD